MDISLYELIIVKFAITIFAIVLVISFRLFYPFFIGRPKDLHKLAGAKWALVTGASDGIGKEYAMQLAKRKFNVILIARSGNKLKIVEAEIQRKYPLSQTKQIVFDFTNSSVEDYQKKILAELEAFNIGILVNNVGVANKLARFEDSNADLQKIVDDLNVNIYPHTLLSAFVLKQMAARNSGIIINVANASRYSLSHMAVYSSSKKYLSWFSSILHKESRGTGLTIQTVCPRKVCTKLRGELGDVRQPSFFAPCAEKFVAQAIRTVGLVSETSGCFAHQLQTESSRIIPEFVHDFFVRRRIHKIQANAQSQQISAHKV